jgi:hypothetical protein
MPEGQTGLDRRGTRRQRVLKKGLILFNDGRSSVGCQILDLTDIGAKLLPIDVFSCPGEFILKPQIGEDHHCEVMWRRGDRIGVRFLPRSTDDRRRHSRNRGLQRGVIVYNNGHSTMACQIVNTSTLGAKLLPADVYACPRQFLLKPKNSGPRQCAVLWRKGSAIGVRFL